MSTDLFPELYFPTAENRNVRADFLGKPTPRKVQPADHGCGTRSRPRHKECLWTRRFSITASIRICR